jgi:hypothetical protein
MPVKKEVQQETFPSEGFEKLNILESIDMDYKEIKFILRTIGAVPSGAGLITVDQAENYINSFLKEGWKIFKFDVLESLPEGRRVSWLLVR